MMTCDRSSGARPGRPVTAQTGEDSNGTSGEYWSGIDRWLYPWPSAFPPCHPKQPLGARLCRPFDPHDAGFVGKGAVLRSVGRQFMKGKTERDALLPSDDDAWPVQGHAVVVRQVRIEHALQDIGKVPDDIGCSRHGIVSGRKSAQPSLECTHGFRPGSVAKGLVRYRAHQGQHVLDPVLKLAVHQRELLFAVDVIGNVLTLDENAGDLAITFEDRPVDEVQEQRLPGTGFGIAQRDRCPAADMRASREEHLVEKLYEAPAPRPPEAPRGRACR